MTKQIRYSHSLIQTHIVNGHKSLLQGVFIFLGITEASWLMITILRQSHVEMTHASVNYLFAFVVKFLGFLFKT